MSFSKNDQVFPVKPRVISDTEIARIVADSLRKDFGDTPSAVKHIGRVTNASLRAIRNWYEARNAPSSGHLLLLAKSSPSILEFLLKQIGGDQLLDAFLLFSRQPPSLETTKIDGQSEVYSIKNETINFSLPQRIVKLLNARQLWFMARLSEGTKGKAEDIANEWDVSIASAKRDISQIVKLQLIQFEGARKTGFYSLKP